MSNVYNASMDIKGSRIPIAMQSSGGERFPVSLQNSTASINKNSNTLFGQTFNGEPEEQVISGASDSQNDFSFICKHHTIGLGQTLRPDLSKRQSTDN